MIKSHNVHFLHQNDEAVNEMARAIVLTSEQWFLLSGTEKTDGGLIINLNEMQKNTINPRKLVPFTSSNSLHMFYLLFVEVDSLSILYTTIRAGRGQCPPSHKKIGD
jgi:hypothetical protein